MAGAGVELETTRSFVAGAFGFTVATSNSEDRTLVESLFQDLPPPHSGVPASNVFVLMRTDIDGDTRWMLGGPRLEDGTPFSLVTALTRLLGAVNLCALDAGPEGLHLHAGAATKDGRAVIVAAKRDTGKTTTIAHLLTRGWAFMTDETVCLDADEEEMSGFPKPLSIKPGGRQLVEHLEPWMIPPPDDGAESFRFVPVGATGASLATSARPHLVILLRRPAAGGPSTGPVSRPLHPADAVVALMQETLDAERFGFAAARLATLAATSHCYELTIGNPSETAERIDELFRLEPLDPPDIVVLPPSPATRSSVVSVAVGDRAVVHDQETGQIFALDAAAARIWQHLGGWSVDSIDLDGPVVAPFVAQLRALGVLTDATPTGARTGPNETR